MNNGDINDMLGRVLQNPDALSGIMKIAQNIKSNSDGTASSPQRDDDGGSDRTPELPEGQIREVLARADFSRFHDENRTRLLTALKPYLGKGRREKVDYILNILRLMELAGAANLLPPQK